jgi:hypothetical protein
MMKSALIILISMAVLFGCTTLRPPIYATKADNTLALRKMDVAEGIVVTGFSSDISFDNTCRTGAFFTIEPPDGVDSYVEYIGYALADELKIAGLYGDSRSPRISLSVNLDSLSFSTVYGADGNWSISLTLNSSNGESMTVDEYYKFEPCLSG